jgi:Rps23 Pro-64 3,4-dihydroxylase Tpa1-like proline 4-hydroxylase
MNNLNANQFVNLDQLEGPFKGFNEATPFNYCVVDNFLRDDVALKVSDEFLDHNSDKWFVYSNPLEDKKALNDWNMFPRTTYQLFSFLNSDSFIQLLSGYTGLPLLPDHGLHGGGWHSHSCGGNLNPHLDYSMHPKLHLQRVINLIIYINPSYKAEYGGHLGLWTNNPESNKPDILLKEVEPRFNRAVFFNTTQNSWHGMSRGLPDKSFVRRSLAVYYLHTPEALVDERARALYAPRAHQIGDKDVEELILLRANVDTSTKVYKK